VKRATFGRGVSLGAFEEVFGKVERKPFPLVFGPGFPFVPVLPGTALVQAFEKIDGLLPCVKGLSARRVADAAEIASSHFLGRDYGNENLESIVHVLASWISFKGCFNRRRPSNALRMKHPCIALPIERG
jgi:hypothetical protein